MNSVHLSASSKQLKTISKLEQHISIDFFYFFWFANLVVGGNLLFCTVICDGFDSRSYMEEF